MAQSQRKSYSSLERRPDDTGILQTGILQTIYPYILKTQSVCVCVCLCVGSEHQVQYYLTIVK